VDIAGLDNDRRTDGRDANAASKRGPRDKRLRQCKTRRTQAVSRTLG